MKNFLEKKFRRMGQKAEKKIRQKLERVILRGLDRRTSEEIVKWNQMTALRFQMGGDIRHPQSPFTGVIIELDYYVWVGRNFLEDGVVQGVKEG